MRKEPNGSVQVGSAPPAGPAIHVSFPASFGGSAAFPQARCKRQPQHTPPPSRAVGYQENRCNACTFDEFLKRHNAERFECIEFDEVLMVIDSFDAIDR